MSTEERIKNIERSLNRILAYMESKEIPKLMSIKDVCNLTSLSYNNVRRLMNEGDLPYSRVNNRIVIKEKDVLDFIKKI